MRKNTGIFDKNYLIKAFSTFLTALFALGVIFYISYHIADRFKTEMSLLNATYKTVVENIYADAYIFRDETTLSVAGLSEGSVAPAVHNGEKVSAYKKVADIYNYTSPDIEKRIAEIDEQILLLEQSRSEDLSVLSAAGLDGEIYRNVQEIRTNSVDGNFGDALSGRTELLVNIKKRDILTGNVRDFDEQIRILEQEKSALTAKLGERLASIYAPSAGYYYSESDGYEEIFTTQALEGLTYDGFYRLIETEPTNGGLTAGKLAVDYRWYIACPMTKAEAAFFEEGESYSVTFPYNNQSLNMQLYSVIGETSGTGAVAVFECRSLPYDFDYMRRQPVQIRATDYTGFEIPTSAIRIVDGYEGVYVLDEVVVDFRRVNILYEYDGFFLCTGEVAVPDDTGDDEDSEYPWIKLNDIIISEGKDLHIGKIMS